MLANLIPDFRIRTDFMNTVIGHSRERSTFTVSQYFDDLFVRNDSSFISRLAGTTSVYNLDVIRSNSLAGLGRLRHEHQRRNGRARLANFVRFIRPF